MKNRNSIYGSNVKRIPHIILILRILSLFTFSCFASGTSAQSSDAKIRAYIDKVNPDTLVSYVRILSGEDPVNGQLIINRVSGSATHEFAGDYIKQKLKSFGLKTFDQHFTWYGGFFGEDLVSGDNIYGVQEGIDTTSKYIICAHYDAVANYGADDNASGTAAVLEAARILSGTKPDHTIIYAFWDQEEAWMAGSGYYAARADSLQQNIRGVLNLDMIGWDGNDDGKAEIHSRFVGYAPDLAGMINKLNLTCSIGLNPVLVNPGKANSDHVPFLGRNFPAVLLIESFTGDFNPYYHTENDRINRFNLGYYYRMVKLAVAGIVSMSAAPTSDIDVIDNPGAEMVLEQNYPNPVPDFTVIRFYLPESTYASLDIYNLSGFEVASLLSDHLSAGNHQITWKPGDLPKGIYFCKLQSEGKTLTRKIAVGK